MLALWGVKEPLALPPGLQVAFVQKRFHKDIFPNPVLMLNFCPAVEPAPGDLQSVTREVLFLVDRSGTMSGPDVDKVKVRRGSGGWGLSPSGRPSAALPVPAATPGSSAGGPEEPPIGDPAQHRRLRLRCPATLPLQPPLQQRECCWGKHSPGPLHPPHPDPFPMAPVRPTSRASVHPCIQETLHRACRHLGELRVATGGPDLLAALSWALAQPLHHGYPRQLFLFTAAAAAGGTGRILQLVRRQASTARYGTAVGARHFFPPKWGFSARGSFLQVLQLRHGPTGMPAAADSHGQAERGLCRVPEPS